MGNQRELPRSHPVQVGDIFVQSHTDEVGHSTRFVQVVALRGKTLVEVVTAGHVYYLDDCPIREDEVGVRPIRLNDEEAEKRERTVTRACVCDEGQRVYLRTLGRKWQEYFYRYEPDSAYYDSGYWSSYGLTQLGMPD